MDIDLGTGRGMPLKAAQISWTDVGKHSMQVPVCAWVYLESQSPTPQTLFPSAPILGLCDCLIKN